MLSLSIRQVHKQFRNGSLLPSELCAACISRSRYVKQLNAFVQLTENSANCQALKSDERYKNDCTKGILDGIPIALKDNFCTQGITTTCSSRMLENFIPPYSATVVEKLENAGAVITGKCNMDEFGMGSGTVDTIHGPTKNIWGSKIKYKVSPKHLQSKPFHSEEFTGADLPTTELNTQENNAEENDRPETTTNESDWLIAGGSSGGSAVAVATGAVFVALGSDTGGSMRNPASYCGVVGLKPTYGLISRHGLIPLVNSMDVPGIFARTVNDIASVLNVIAGCDIRDSTTVGEDFSPVELDECADLKEVHIGIPKEYHCPGLSTEVVEIWMHVADMLEDAGARVTQVSMPHTSYSNMCYSVLNQSEVASNMARYEGIRFGLRTSEAKSMEELFAASRRQGFNEVVRSRILAGNYFLLESNYQKYFVQALKVRRLIVNDFASVWSQGIDVLLTPTTLTDAPSYSDFTSLDNREQCAIQDFCTQTANMSGCPAISLPISLSKRGLPLSLQLMGENFKESKLLTVAKWIENVVDFPGLEIL